MISFECDYNNGAHPDVLRHLMETNNEMTDTYGFDRFTQSAKDKIRQACQAPEAAIYFLGGGTQTNDTVIDGLLRSYEAVITIETGHIAVHEAGAIEHTGHKVITLPSHDGKLLASELDEWMQVYEADESREHVAQPGMVYISLPTELGTLYRSEEIVAIHDVCTRHGLLFYIDGARLGYGIAASRGDITLPFLARHCDAFYIGGTKVGALCGEAVVFPRGNAPRGFFSIVKQHGALFAKGRLCGVQFDALFTDDLYLRISQHAILMAHRLVALFREKGLRLYIDSPTNQQFVILPNEQMHQLEQHVQFTHWGPYDADHFICRFVTSWATTQADIETLGRLLPNNENK
ncbi:MAG: amino acid lyase [Prevotella sp.]|nr:amino acid lyase [Prevotella sp.]